MKIKFTAIRLSLLLILSVILVSCSDKEVEKIALPNIQTSSNQEEDSSISQENNSGEEENTNQDSSSEMDVISKEEKATNSSSLPQSNIKDLTILNTEAIDGKIYEIFNGNHDEILLLANQLYLYDVTTQSVIATSDNNLPKFIDSGIYKISNGYALMGNIMEGGASEGTGMSSSSELGFTCYLYDDDLKETNKISIPSYFGGIPTITITPDGKDILYYSPKTRAIKKLNISSGDITIVQDYSNVSIGELCGIEYLAVNYDNSKIIFKGKTLSSEESVSSYGTISIDGSAAVNKQYDGYRIDENAVFRGDTLLLPEDGRGLTGRLLLMDANTTNEKMINLPTSKATNGRIAISNNGNYFATGELATNEYIVRIYNTSDGKLLNTASITDDRNEYFARGSLITISEDSRVCTVSLGDWNNDINTKMYSFGF